jgi:hypothetical protein
MVVQCQSSINEKVDVRMSQPCRQIKIIILSSPTLIDSVPTGVHGACGVEIFAKLVGSLVHEAQPVHRVAKHSWGVPITEHVIRNFLGHVTTLETAVGLSGNK